MERNPAAMGNYGFQKIIVAVGVALLGMKLAAWLITSSVAIMTDALESVVNVAAGLIGLYALYLAAKPADREHPFGHGGAETISSSIEGVMIAVAGAFIIMEASSRILNPQEIRQLDLGLVLVAVAGAVNYALGRTAISKGRRNGSPALEASGKHLCSDTYSSIGIIAGLLAMTHLSSVGHDLPWIDGAIAMFFGFVILGTGAGVVKKSMDAVLGTADTALLGCLLKILNAHRREDWIDVHAVRVLKVGSTLHVDMHIVLPRHMAVWEQQMEFSRVGSVIKWEFGDRVDVNIMAEPCLDAHCPHCPKGCAVRAAGYTGREEWTLEGISAKGAPK
ncbi:MAG: cation transporter [Thermoplasmatales archaeon]|nr:cation transporter [Thermoplasmatales archaeon]